MRRRTAARAGSADDARALSPARRERDDAKEPLQVQINNLRAVIESHSIPATAIHHFTVPVLHSIIDTFKLIDTE